MFDGKLASFATPYPVYPRVAFLRSRFAQNKTTAGGSRKYGPREKADGNNINFYVLVLRWIHEILSSI